MGWVSTAAKVVKGVTGAISAVRGLSGSSRAGGQATALQNAQIKNLNAQTRTADLQRMMSEYMFNRYKGEYVPMEQRWLETIKKGENPEEEAAASVSDVRQSFDVRGDMAERELQRRGINPNDGRIATLLVDNGLDEAKAAAGAGTGARRYAKQRTFDMLADAVNVGRGTAAAGAATAAGASAGYGSAAAGYGGAAANAYERSRQLGEAAGGALNDTLDWIDSFAQKYKSPSTTSSNKTSVNTRIGTGPDG